MEESDHERDDQRHRSTRGSTSREHSEDHRRSIRLSRDFPQPPTSHARNPAARRTQETPIAIDNDLQEYRSNIASLRQSINPFDEEPRRADSRQQTILPLRPHHSLYPSIPYSRPQPREDTAARRSLSSQQRWFPAGGTVPLAERQEIIGPEGWNEEVISRGTSMSREEVERGLDMWLQSRRTVSAENQGDGKEREKKEKDREKDGEKDWKKRMFGRRRSGDDI